MKAFSREPVLDSFTRKRLEFLDNRVGALSTAGIYALVIGGAGLLVIIPAQLMMGSEALSSSPVEILLGLLFIALSICAIICVINGLLALWAWSTIAVRSSLKMTQSPFPRYWRRPYAPRVAILLLVIAASIPAIYFRFHDPALFFGILVLVAVVSKWIVSKF